MAILNQAKVNSTIPDTSSNPVDVSVLSNTHRINNVNVDIVIEKTSNKDWIIPEDKVVITTKITNNTDEDITNIKIKDSFSDDVSFVVGSVKIGEQTYADFDPVSGYTMPITLGGSGGEMTTSYEIVANKYLTDTKIEANSLITLELDQKKFELNSNIVELTVLNNEVYILKQANTTAVKSGDTITYTITISNQGTLKNTNIVFTDPLPSTVSFVAGSVKIDNEEKSDLNPVDGFAIKDLNPNESIIIEFKVIAN